MRTALSLAAVLLLVGLVLAIGFRQANEQAGRELEIPPPIPAEEIIDQQPKNPGWDVFKAWFATHERTCEQCSRMKDDPNVGFCMDAFLKLQECLRKPAPPVAPDEPTPVDVPPVAPPAASPSQAAPNSCQGGACAPRRYQAPPRRRGFFQRMFGR